MPEQQEYSQVAQRPIKYRHSYFKAMGIRIQKLKSIAHVHVQ